MKDLVLKSVLICQLLLIANSSLLKNSNFTDPPLPGSLKFRFV